jgi:hypothetical protein
MLSLLKVLSTLWRSMRVPETFKVDSTHLQAFA